MANLFVRHIQKAYENTAYLYGPQTGAYLGSVARIIERIACDSDTKVLSTQIYDTWHSTAQAKAPVSSGRQFFLKARDLLPELRKAPSLLTTMESMIQESPEVAIREFVESSSSIYAICKCSFCNDRTGRQENSHISERDEPFCFGLLIEVICSLVRLSSLIVFHENLSSDSFLLDAQKKTTEQVRLKMCPRLWWTDSASICELCEISAEPERACSVHIVPGRIEWNGHLYSQVRDAIRGVDYQDINHSSEWLSTGSSLVKNYNLLCDSSTGNLAVDLQIDGALPVTDSIVARWHIIPEVIKRVQLTYTTAWIGPQFIARQLAMAWIGKDFRLSRQI
ncbi:hypothetical protein B0O99DRAFT_598875 [Bisporella sp. PMI_857]|nr:hypothetical protein B0O99DRAFT_598875 [Bisporella sp. PMI_857]